MYDKKNTSPMMGKKEQTAATANDVPSSTAFQGEFLCTTCEREGVNTEASNYCMECEANLCPTCVNQHKKFPTMRGHKILSKSARRHITHGLEEDENLLECHNHPGKMVDMYCPEHDEVSCGGCMAVYHK